MGFRRKTSKRIKGRWGNKGRHSRRGTEPGGSEDGESDGQELLPLRLDSSATGRHVGLPVVPAQGDAHGVVTLEVRHNTMVIMEAGVQDRWEHRIFKPSLAQLSGGPVHADAASNQEREGVLGDGEDARADGEGDTDLEPRINLTFHVHVSKDQRGGRAKSG